MGKCYLCAGERTADLVRVDEGGSYSRRQPICEFHTKEIQKDLTRGHRWDGSPLPHDWKIVTYQYESPRCPLCGTRMFMGVVGTDLDGTYSEQWFCRGRDCRGNITRR
jgi:hypothetical protein